MYPPEKNKKQKNKQTSIADDSILSHSTAKTPVNFIVTWGTVY